MQNHTEGEQSALHQKATGENSEAELKPTWSLKFTSGHGHQ